ncbi:MAG: phosphatidylglycerophosphatase A [Desulfobacteraceae bacterium]
MKRQLLLWLATVGGVGYLPLMPGTWGTLAGGPLWWLMAGLKPGHYGIVLLGLLILSVWATGWAEVYLGQRDASAIVIDEVVGLLVALAGRPRHWGWVLGGFLLFRVFDIWKPFPIFLIDEQIKGGAGIVLDDVLAGIYAWLVLTLLSRVI